MSNTQVSKWVLLFAVVAVLVQSATSTAESDIQKTEAQIYANKPEVCPDGYGSHSKHCFLFQRKPATWPQARFDCLSSDGDLAKVDEELLPGIYRQFVERDGYESMWIGLSKWLKIATWFWSDGTPLGDYQIWRFFTFNSQRPRDCVFMYSTWRTSDLEDNGKWEVSDCNDQRGYVCQATPARVPWRLDSRRCDFGWHSDIHSDTCYNIIYDAVTKAEAATQCEAKGGNLAVITSLHEQQVVAGIATEASTYQDTLVWFEAPRNVSRGSWNTGSGIPFKNFEDTNTEVAPGSCLVIDTQSEGKRWRKVDCHQTHPAVCQKPAVRPRCDESGGWSNFRGSCHRVFNEDATWDGAKGRCEAEGAKMAFLDNVPEKNFVYDLIANKAASKLGKAWLGLWLQHVTQTDSVRPMWLDGTPIDDRLNYWNTPTGELTLDDLASNATCVAMDTNLSRLRSFGNALSCNTKLPFVCRKREMDDVTTTTAPTETVPTETVPTETVPTETVPTETVPTETVPTETVPTETVPTTPTTTTRTTERVTLPTSSPVTPVVPVANDVTRQPNVTSNSTNSGNSTTERGTNTELTPVLIGICVGTFSLIILLGFLIILCNWCKKNRCKRNRTNNRSIDPEPGHSSSNNGVLSNGIRRDSHDRNSVNGNAISVGNQGMNYVNPWPRGGHGNSDVTTTPLGNQEGIAMVTAPRRSQGNTRAHVGLHSNAGGPGSWRDLVARNFGYAGSVPNGRNPSWRSPGLYGRP